MVQEVLGAFEHPLAMVAGVVALFFALRLSWIVLTALVKLSLVCGVLWLAVKIVPMIPVYEGSRGLSHKLKFAAGDLISAKEFLLDELSRYEVRFKDNGGKRSRADEERGISRF